MSDQRAQMDVYHKLTPIDDVKLGEYENVMLYALNDTDTRNIAITGVYGSGKSSLIKTFEAEYKHDRRFNFLNVSLASFAMGLNPKFEEENISSNNKKYDTQDIEKSLLQQIIFKVKSDFLEDSQFSRIRIKRYWLKFLASNLGLAFFLITLLLSIKFVFEPQHSLFQESWLFKQDYMSYFVLIALIGTIGLVQFVLNFVPKLGLSKLSAGGAEISFNERRGDSILNKHLDELIYFFATTRFNVVVFEDLDRLPNYEILIKLREINQLLNNSEEINKHGKKKVIKFIYALSDNLFLDAIDRTKFFDLIIPVIPTVNFSNSRNKLEAAIKKAFPKIEFSPNFLDEVAQFLDDMRLLFNIANEFIVYKKRLDAESDGSSNEGKLKLDDNKLLALIIYKNKYPGDFELLNQRRGKVWSILSSKDKLLGSLKANIDSEIKALKEQILDLEAEKLLGLDELKRIYLGQYLIQYNDLTSFQISGTNYAPSQLLEDEAVFELLQSESNVQYVTHRGYTKPLEPFSCIEKAIHSQLTYSQRKEHISKLNNGFVTTLNSKLKKYEKELGDLQQLSLSQLLNRQSDGVFSELQANDGLIKYLLIEGLIGEDFLAYTTYFYPGELSSNDQQYLISQLSNTPLAIAYKLDNPDKVFEKIKEERFKSAAILNLDMLTFISLNKTRSNKAGKFIDAIIDSEDSGKNLLHSWFKLASLGDASKKFVLNKITKKDENFWSRYFDALELTSDEKVSFLKLLLQHLDDEALKLINNTGFIQFEINENLELLNSIGVLGYENLEKIFKQLKLVFSDISGCNDIRLLGVVEKTSAYDITIGNLIKLLSASGQPAEIIVPTYSYVLQNGSEAIKNYIERELRWFASSVLQNLENPREQESAALHLLKSDDLEAELKISLIQKLIFEIKDIRSVTDQVLWPELLKSKRVVANWPNVLKYFSLIEQEVDEVLIHYLSDEENLSSLIKVALRHDVADESKLARKIISCDEIDDGAYKRLLKAILMSFYKLDDIEVNKNKLNALLVSRKFMLDVENHQFLKTNFPEKSCLLLAQNFDYFIKNLSEIAVENYELIGLISASELDHSQKMDLIKVTPDSLYDAGVAKTYCEYVLNRTRKNSLDIKLIKKILSFDFEQGLKIRLFNRYSDQLDHASIVEIVSKMLGPQKPVSNLVNNKHAVLTKDNESLKFANFLRANEYINSRDYKKGEGQIELIPKKKIIK